MMTSFFQFIESKVSDKQISIVTAGSFLVAVLMILVPAYLLFGELVAIGIVSAGIAASLCFISPTWWIYGVLFSSYFFYAKSSTEESSQPIIFAMAYHLSLFVWMFSHVWLKKQKLITHWIDLLYLLFLGFLALNGILSYLNDVEFMSWIKGWQLYLIVLYYYPIREIFKDKNQQNALLMICAIVILIQGASNIYQYKIALTNFKFASQLFYVGIRQGAAVFTVASLVTIVGIIYTKKTILRVMLVCFHVFCFSVLIVSLARTAWVGYVIGLIIIGLVTKGTYRKHFLIGSLSIGLIIIMVSSVFLGQYTNTAYNVINKRFSSSAGFATDPSYLSRIYENEVLIKGIIDYPLGGEGLQKIHKRYDAINRFTVVNTYAHNNYLGSAQKMGLPLAFLFFGILSTLLIRNWRISRNTTNSRELFFSVSSLSGLCGLFVINFVGSIFDQREGVFLMAILFTFSFLASNQDKDNFLVQKKIIPE
ncbi:MAG: O-antigen ligase family protein [Ignavibacteria bacterium]|nr:O-antigen ligase family protein [Ignavibacteria bacterium]